jgi:hypothetical protein
LSKGSLAKNPWYARANALTLTLSLKMRLSKIQFDGELKHKEPAQRPALRIFLLLILSPVAPASVPVLFLIFDSLK